MSGVEFSTDVVLGGFVELADVPVTHPMIGKINALRPQRGERPLQKEDEIKPGFYLVSGDTARQLL